MKKKFMVVFAAALTVMGLIFIPPLVAQFNTPSFANGRGGPGNPGAMPGVGGGSPAAVFTVRTENAEIRSLQACIEVNGNIVSQDQVMVVPEAAGKLVSMKAVIGQTLRRGDLLAEVDPSRPGAEYSLSPVYAPVSGMVVSNPASVGSTVTTASVLLTMAVAGSLEIEALIPEREVGQLRQGLQAEVRLEAFPGEIFSAKVAKLSPVVDPISRTKSITLRFVRDDPRINAGMFARVKVNTRSYENVVSIPQNAVVENRGSTAVFVLVDDDGEGVSRVSMKEVSPGVTIDGETEIKSGLAAGDKVVVQGQQFLTNGAAVRVLGSKT